LLGLMASVLLFVHFVGFPKIGYNVPMAEK